VHESIFCSTLPSPIGDLLLVSNGEALTGVHMTPHPAIMAPQDDALLRGVRDQLLAYFAGELLDFDLPLAPQGTPFQHRVWEALRRVPYGTTASYLDIARRIGRPTAPRAVGAANGRNPIAIIVPCHRVIGADGTLIGYGGGLDRKRWLLRHEADVLARPGARDSRQRAPARCALSAISSVE
jgi:methylated-DNA-[protein]-cysteine S-methyltransferase